MNRPLRLLLLSCVRHQGAYAPLFASRPDVEIVGIADDAGIPGWMHDVNQRFARDYGVPYVRDVDAALARDDIDAVSICSEPTRHANLALRAVRANKHVWVDKPIATTLADADLIVAAADASDFTLTYVHRLFSPTITAARAALDRGDLGLPFGLDVVYLTAGGLTSGAVEDFQLVVDRSLSGGGEVINFLGYPIDIVRYLTGLEIRQVYASAGTYFFEPHRACGVEDLGVICMRLEHGVVATVTVGRTPTPHHPTGGDFTLRVHGSAGSWYSDENRPVLNVFSESVPSRSYGAASAAPSTLELLVDEFLTCIRTKSRPMRTARDGRHVVAVIEAAYRSMASGQVESVEI